MQPRYWWRIMSSKQLNEMPFSGYFAEAARAAVAATHPYLTINNVPLLQVLDLGAAVEDVDLDEWGDDSWMVEDWFDAGDNQRLDSAVLLDDDRFERDDTTLTRTVRWLRQLMS